MIQQFCLSPGVLLVLLVSEKTCILLPPRHLLSASKQNTSLQLYFLKCFCGQYTDPIPRYAQGLGVGCGSDLTVSLSLVVLTCGDCLWCWFAPPSTAFCLFYKDLWFFITASSSLAPWLLTHSACAVVIPAPALRWCKVGLWVYRKTSLQANNVIFCWRHHTSFIFLIPTFSKIHLVLPVM